MITPEDPDPKPEATPPAKAKAKRPKKRRAPSRHGCDHDTFAKIAPLVDAIEHYHLEHTGPDCAITELRVSDACGAYLDSVGEKFADTYIVSAPYHRAKFRELADQLRKLGDPAVMELYRLQKLRDPKPLEPAKDPLKD
jgi:hypothetical protein